MPPVNFSEWRKMAKANQGTKIMSGEDDGDEDRPGSDAQNLTPNPPPQLRSASNGSKTNGADEQPVFEAIEVDDAGKPLRGTAQDDDDVQHDDGAADERESNLSDEESADRPLVGNDGRREPKSSRRARQRAAREAKDRENEDLKAELRRLRGQVEDIEAGTGPRLATLEKRFSKETAAQLDNNVEKAKDALDKAKKSLAAALREGDEDKLADALEARDEAFVNKLTADGAKEQYKRQVGQRDGADDEGPVEEERQPRGREERRDSNGKGQQRPLSQQAQRNVQSFIDANDWFDPDGADEDSKLVLFVDAQVKRAGFRPENKDYWDELNKRLVRRMPERFGDDALDDEDNSNDRKTPRTRQNGNGAENGRRPSSAQPQRRGPMTGGSDQRQDARPGTVKITPQRKEAMILAGVVANNGQITDQAKYQRMLKQYAEFDTNQSRLDVLR